MWCKASAFLVFGSVATACTCASYAPLCNLNFDDYDPAKHALFVGRVVRVTPGSIEDYQRLAKTYVPPSPSPTPTEKLTRSSRLDEELRRQNTAYAVGRARMFLHIWGEHIPTEKRAELQSALNAGNPTELDRLSPIKTEIVVEESFVGDYAGTTVFVGTTAGNCGYQFLEGERYLVDAWVHPTIGALETSICAQTAPEREARASIRFLRAWRDGLPEPPRYLTGHVSDSTIYPPDAWPKHRPIPLRLEGPSGYLTTSSDFMGRFEFLNLAPGRYQIEAVWPGYSVMTREGTPAVIDLESNRCLSVGVGVSRLQGSILVRFRPAPGETLPTDLRPALVPTSGPEGRYQRLRRPTSADGVYRLKNIPRGDYVLRVNDPSDSAGPHPRSYYPGVLDRSRAAVFRVRDGREIKLRPWVLPPALKERRISGVVRLPDGSPVAGARVVALRRIDANLSRTQLQAGPTEADGRFELRPFVTRSYQATALVSDDEGNLLKAAVEITPTTRGPLAITVTPTEPTPADVQLIESHIWRVESAERKRKAALHDAQAARDPQ